MCIKGGDGFTPPEPQAPTTLYYNTNFGAEQLFCASITGDLRPLQGHIPCSPQSKGPAIIMLPMFFVTRPFAPCYLLHIMIR